MRTRRGATIASLMAATGLALALAVVPASATAQDQEPECRCVDRDGNEIEGCTCFRTDRLERLGPRFEELGLRLEGLGPRIEMMMPRLEGLERSLEARGPRVALFGDRRARLGMTIRVAEPSAADADGAEVNDVLEGGPAHDAGIRAGDVITHLDGHSLAEPLSAEQERDLDLDASVPAQRLLALARELEPGESVEIRYLRDGRPQTTMVEARDLSEAWGVRVPEGRGLGAHFYFGGSGAAAGLDFAEVGPELGAYFGVEEGVLVTAVRPSSTLGLEAGDVVLAVGGREVRTPDRIRRILSSYTDGEEIELRVVRNGEERVLTAPMRE